MGNTSFLFVQGAWNSVPAPVLHGAVHLPFGVPDGGRLPLVVELLALGQTDLQLGPGVFEVEGEGDQGVPVLLDLLVEPQDLPLVHQELPGTAGVLVEDIALLIGADVHAVDRQLPVLGDAVGVLQVHVAQADGLDLGARQGDARLVLLLDEVVVIGLGIF